MNVFKLAFLTTSLCMFCFAAQAAAPQGDAELSAETSEDEMRYAGVFPEHVKTVACLSPASHPGRPSHKRGIELLKKAGLKVKVMPNAFAPAVPGKRSTPLAGRLEDFYAAWNDPEVDMILCIRGGEGCEELLKNLDWKKLKPRPELYLQGYSDVTQLTAAMLAKGLCRPIAGPMAGSMAGQKPESIKEMKAMYHGEQVGPIKLKPLVPGDCSGLPLSGLLERLRRVSRADYCPNTKGRIIFIEVVYSSPKLIREHLQELLDRKFFDGAAGVVYCQFFKCGKAAEVNAVLEEFAPKFGVPVYRGFPFGHSSRCATIDFSRQVVIKDNELTFPAVVAKEK